MSGKKTQQKRTAIITDTGMSFIAFTSLAIPSPTIIKITQDQYDHPMIHLSRARKKGGPI
jgi:hypothetical protein